MECVGEERLRTRRDAAHVLPDICDHNPRSFHPVFETTFVGDGFVNCTLNVLYTLPPIIFVDPYELSNRAYSFQHLGPSNLELPVAAVANEDATLLLSTPWVPEDNPRVFELPLHVRYGPVGKTEGLGFVQTDLKWPDAFFACPDASSSSDTLPLIPPSLVAPFATSSIFIVGTPPDAVPIETLRTPVGTTADVATVELGTAVVVLASFSYLVRVARRTVKRLSTTTVSAKED
ncbi:PIG-X [Roridomyces roridus]|uniref:Protein PBN1 n=1 Tax=Roridomyces roridus TaxID=1738132 RepID=A0AAD7FNW9_9AGAR|nr:PIG-X [Roridomyces roridus]